MKSFILKMRAKRAGMKAKEEFRQAAFAYMGLKTAIMVLSYAFLPCPDCEYTQFIGKAVHLLLFSHFIYAGMRITSAIIGFICLFRGAAYMANFFYQKTFLLSLPVTGAVLEVLRKEGSGHWVFLVNGFLMFLIALFILRAALASSKTMRKTALRNNGMAAACLK